MTFDFAFFEKSAEYVRARAPFQPEIAIVLGSCLGPFADSIQNPVSIDYAEIPNFLISTAPSHAGKLIFGTVAAAFIIMRAMISSSSRFRFACSSSSA